MTGATLDGGGRPDGVKRVLITGMSGVGKSAVTAELGARGHRAVDLDTPEWSAWVCSDPADTLTPERSRDWVWREDAVRALLAAHDRGVLFVSGCAQNMARLYPLIDTIILLSAPLATLMERLAARSGDRYGSSEEDRRKVRELIALVEPLLRQSADYEVDTARPLAATVDDILRIC